MHQTKPLCSGTVNSKHLDSASSISPPAPWSMSKCRMLGSALGCIFPGDLLQTPHPGFIFVSWAAVEREVSHVGRRVAASHGGR